MTSIFKKITIISITLTFFTNLSFAQFPSFSSPGTSGNSGAEFFVGKIEGKPLIQVNIVSGLKMPGVYHIPVDTSLAELISYAGGAVDGAQLDKINIKGDSKNMKVYDFYTLSNSSQKMPNLNNGDIVQIDVENDSLARTALIVGMTASITAVILSVLTYSKK